MLRRALTGLTGCVNVHFRAQVLPTSVVYGEKHADLGGEDGMYVQGEKKIPSCTLKSQGKSLICGWEVSVHPVIMQEDRRNANCICQWLLPDRCTCREGTSTGMESETRMGEVR